MITYITLAISILSFLFSAFIFFSQILSNRYKLGISINESIPDTEKELLYLRISFINESSAPITIQNLILLNHKKETFVDYGMPNEYAISNGELFPERVSVGSKYPNLNKSFKAETEYLPFVVQPYGSFTGFFAFFLKGRDSVIVDNNVDIFLEVETSKGFFLTEKNFSPIHHRLVEFRDQKARPVFIYWNISPTRKIIPFLKTRLQKTKWWLTSKSKRILKWLLP